MGDGAWNLFLDDAAVARATGFDRVLHHPKPRGVVIPADRPWETNGVMPTYVGRRADGSFVCLYTAMWWDIDRAEAAGASASVRQDRPHQIFTAAAYAVSDDGVNWRKPSLGLVETPAGVDRARRAPFPAPVGITRDNNCGVPFAVVADLALHGNVADPQRRFAIRAAPAAVHGTDVFELTDAPKSRGYFAAELPDFLNDPEWRAKLADTGGDFSPRHHSVQYWDAAHGEWAAIEQLVWPNWLPSRDLARFASKDLVHWHSRAVLYPDADDAHDLEHYEEPMSMTPYYSDGVLIGLLSWFHSDRSTREGGPVLDPTAAHPQRWPWARKGTCDLRVTISRDGGLTWDRTVSRRAWIEHGRGADDPDRVLAGCLPPLRVGDEDWFYVYACDQDHLNTRNTPGQEPYFHDGPSVRHVLLYTQKHNRFVSYRARGGASPDGPRVLISKPLRARSVGGGFTIELNVDARRGHVRVAVASAAPVATYGGAVPSDAPHLRAPLEGYGFDDCDPVLVDRIDQPVTFRGARRVQVSEAEVCLLFEVHDADLYGFRLAPLD